MESRLNETGVTTDLINFYCNLVVPGGGFEPPTRGFSVHCSTPELPGQGKAIRFGFDTTMASRLCCPEGFSVNFRDKKFIF